MFKVTSSQRKPVLVVSQLQAATDTCTHNYYETTVTTSVLDRHKTADVFTSAPKFFDVLLSRPDVL